MTEEIASFAGSVGCRWGYGGVTQALGLSTSLANGGAGGGIPLRADVSVPWVSVRWPLKPPLLVDLDAPRVPLWLDRPRAEERPRGGLVLELPRPGWWWDPPGAGPWGR